MIVSRKKIDIPIERYPKSSFRLINTTRAVREEHGDIAPARQFAK
jgi:hypothetical protein